MKEIAKQKVIDFCYVTDFVANGSFASLRENVSYINSPDYAVLVRLTDFTKKWSKDFVYVSKASYDFLKKSSLIAGDLIISNVGEPGIVFLVPDLKQPMTLGPNSILIRPNEKYSSSKFLYLYFLSEKGKKQIDDISTGAAQKKFNKTSFRDLEIPLPPLPEQQRIVAILDEAFAAIAKAKANAEQNFKNAKELFESYLQGVFENKGEGWGNTQLSKLCLPNRIITYGVIKLGDDIEDGVPCLRTSNVRWLRIDLTGMKRILPELSKEYSRTILEGGEVLVNVRGTLGGVAVVPKTMKGWNVSREVAVVPIDSYKIDPFFISSFIGSETAQNWLGGVKKGAAYVGINIEDLRLLPIPLPKLKEQQIIVQKLDSLSAETKKLEAIYKQKIYDLEELKKSILQKAFSGELKEKELIL